MRKFTYLLLTLVLAASCISAQKKETPGINQERVEQQPSNYQLFETKNIWVLIKLDTRNGKMTQVHFSLDSDSYRGELILNDRALVIPEDEKAGRFTLYPTQNMFTFILLDKVTGRTYQVQWSLKDGERFILPIRK